MKSNFATSLTSWRTLLLFKDKKKSTISFFLSVFRVCNFFKYLIYNYVFDLKEVTRLKFNQNL